MCFCYSVSIRKACQVFNLHTSFYFYKSRKNEQSLLKQCIKDIAYSRVHYGYRRIHTKIQREGYSVNHKHVYRLYKEEGLQMRTKKPKRRVQAKARVFLQRRMKFGIWILFLTPYLLAQRFVF